MIIRRGPANFSAWRRASHAAARTPGIHTILAHRGPPLILGPRCHHAWDHRQIPAVWFKGFARIAGCLPYPCDGTNGRCARCHRRDALNSTQSPVWREGRNTQVRSCQTGTSPTGEDTMKLSGPTRSQLCCCGP